MLQALLHHKLGRAIQDGSFRVIEDTLTSSVIGLLQYLPDNLFWSILRGSCGNSAEALPENVGRIKSVLFWEKLPAVGTYNSRLVEPDVLIETDLFDIIIEAKRSDSPLDNAQSQYQWVNEVVAVINSYSDDVERSILFLAIGGNDRLKDKVQEINGKSFVVHAGSWFNLLNATLHYKSILENSGEAAGPIGRVLSDLVAAIEVHNIFRTVWLDSLPDISINSDAHIKISSNWEFDNHSLFSSLTDSNTHIKIDTLENIWTIRSQH